MVMKRKFHLLVDEIRVIVSWATLNPMACLTASMTDVPYWRICIRIEPANVRWSKVIK